jgi:hypothetical protein
MTNQPRPFFELSETDRIIAFAAAEAFFSQQKVIGTPGLTEARFWEIYATMPQDER